MSDLPPKRSHPAELTRAARLLWLRSRRQASDLFAGEYASAFRGGGVEFEESRPYVPGDDLRSFDWNATARTGEPWVKRFREERSRTVLLALDVSASMAFGTTGRTKAELGAEAAGLLAAAAQRAGDRLGFVAFGGGIETVVAPGRGEAHGWRVVRGALAAARRAGGSTDLAPACEWLRRHARGRSILVLLSDLRLEPDAPAWRRLFPALARRHDFVAALCEDPRERELPAAGALWVSDPERGGAPSLLATGRRAVRERYAAAARARRAELERSLRRAGLDRVDLSTEADPLRPLARFFRERTAHTRIAS